MASNATLPRSRPMMRSTTQRNPAAPTGSYQPMRSSRDYISARAVGAFVPKLTHKAFEKYGFAAATLILEWATIVGRDVAAYTAPERLKWPRGVDYSDPDETASSRPGGTLILRVDPARALDIQYKGQQLIERINAHFGYRAVAELRILQAPLPEREDASATLPPAQPVPAPELADIADEHLRQALTRLKTGLMGRPQKPLS
ncbi:DUF721 domain-containing protein [Hyphomicrobium sulfonivorans]|uniref:DUF721 domain-containing protein n=1 Tax=Hyphomicrobium sulfonivorans TaxID=121290 RepID=UPI0015701763|nr:DciA family protein [Hyphomicrobium sulfonivorans]MBI1648860.1 DUF721 domain-containing protein [Hyphomicrobium sulfonivorans]